MKLFISGASSGLGYHLALEYAVPGNTLGIAARNIGKLSALQKEIEKKGAKAFIYQLDVTQKEQTEKVCNDFLQAAGGIDLLVANAGIRAASGDEHIETEKLTNIINTNVNGLIHLANSFLPYMLEKRKGHIAATGSVAGFRGLPGGTYSASKAAVKSLMDSWRVTYLSKGISFTTLCPGFIDTPMTQINEFTMPFLISAEEGARQMKGAIERKEKTYIFPWQWRFIVPLMGLVPDFIISHFRKMG